MDDGLYELKEDPKPAAKRQTPVRAPAGVATPLASSEPPQLEYQRRIDRPEDLESRVRDFYAPLFLLGGGIVVDFAASWLLERSRPPGVLMFEVGVQMVVWTIVMLAGVLLGARLKGLSLGPFWLGVWKLTALSVAPAAIQSALLLPLQFIPLGGLAAWAIGFLAYFVLLSFLFDLDQEDTWFLVVVIFGVQLAFVAALIWLF